MTVRSPVRAALALLCSSGSMAPCAGRNARWSLLWGLRDRPDIVVDGAYLPARLDLEGTGNFFCVRLGCTQGRAAPWRVDSSAAGEVPQEVGVQVAVDNLGQTPVPGCSAPDRDGVFGLRRAL